MRIKNRSLQPPTSVQELTINLPKKSSSARNEPQFSLTPTTILCIYTSSAVYYIKFNGLFLYARNTYFLKEICSALHIQQCAVSSGSFFNTAPCPYSHIPRTLYPQPYEVPSTLATRSVLCLQSIALPSTYGHPQYNVSHSNRSVLYSQPHAGHFTFTGPTSVVRSSSILYPQRPFLSHARYIYIFSGLTSATRTISYPQRLYLRHTQ